MKKLLLTPLMLAVSITALAITPFTLNNIEVNGVTLQQKQGILQLINVPKGTTVNDAKITSIIKQLYNSGNFENVAVTKKNNNLVIDVQLKPRIASISFKGSNLIPLDELRKIFSQNNVQQGAYLNKVVINQLDSEIERTYKAQGYNQVTVTSSYETLPDGTVNVLINVNQNDKAYLQNLVLVGNKTFTESQLLEDSQVRPDTYWFDLYHTSNFNQANKQALLDLITNYYKNRGYARFKIDSTSETSNDPKKPENITFTVNITEGNKYTINSSNFFSRDSQLTADYQKFNTLKKGEIYNQSQINGIVSNISNYLAGLGYAYNTVQPIYTYNKDNTVNVTFTVNKGLRYTVGSITFTGNTITRDNVIRRQLTQQENSIYNLNAVNDDVFNLQRLGYFKTVTYETQPVDGVPNELNLIYKVTEANNGSFKIGAGYGDLRGLTFMSQFTQSNILGTGRTVSSGIQISKGRYNANLSYTEPFINTYGVSLSNSISFNYVNSKDFSKNQSNINNYKQVQFGLSSGVGVPITRFSAINTSVGYSYSKYTNLSQNYYRGLYLKSIGQPYTPGQEWRVKTKDLTLNLSYDYNSYNYPIFPTKGTSFSIGGSYTGLGSTDNYYVLNTNFHNYYPINNAETWVLSTRFNASYENGIGGKLVPTNSLFTVGGFGTLRGFSYGSVGPLYINSVSSSPDLNKSGNWYIQPLDKNNKANVLGGNAIVYGGVDLIFPLFRGTIANSVRTSFFIDTASAWSTNWKAYTHQFAIDNKSTTSSTSSSSSSNSSTQQEATMNYQNYRKLPNYNSILSGFRASAGVSLSWRSPLGLLSFAVSYPLKKEPYDNTEVFSINFGSNF